MSLMTAIPVAEAKPGPRVLVAVEDAVKVESEGEVELKGFRPPLAAYNVVPAVSQCASGSLRLVMALLFQFGESRPNA
jgi:hypothetical protein